MRSKPPSVLCGIQLRAIPENRGLNQERGTNLGQITLHYTHAELIEYAKERERGLSPKSLYWIRKSARVFWEQTGGAISQETITRLKNHILAVSRSESNINKLIGFGRAFLKHLSKLYLNASYQAFELFLEKPKAIKERKLVTDRIITPDDVTNICNHIVNDYRAGKIKKSNCINYLALVGFGCYTGQRAEATIEKLTVGMFRDALSKEYPVILVPPALDKIRYEHYVPLHPNLIPTLTEAIKGRNDDEPMFRYIAFRSWLMRNPLPLTKVNSNFLPGDMRKFGEQFGDQIKWDTVNRAHIMSHDISSISFAHYKAFTAEIAYRMYMEAWENVDLIPKSCSLEAVGN